MNKKLNIVIPMAGLGSRFVEAGFKIPKPLIDVMGKPMYSWAVDSLPLKYANDLIFILLSSQKEYEILKNDILSRYSAFRPIILDVPKLTDGQAVTVLRAKNFIDNGMPLLIHNADTAFDIRENWIEDIWKINADGALLVFNSQEQRWSFSKENIDGWVEEVREKEVISSLATTGTYYFRYGRDFVKYAEERINNKLREANEYYVAPIYNDMISNGALIKNVIIDRLYCFGTPEDMDCTISKLQTEK